MPRITAAERKRQEAEERDRAVYAALAWPQEPCPQPWSATTIDSMAQTLSTETHEIMRAWTYNGFTKQVTRGSYDRFCHSLIGDLPRSKGRGGPWFATEAEARLALRWAVCREMAETLHRLVAAEAKVIVREGISATA